MQLTERILIKRNDPNFKSVAHLCRSAKTLFNCGNYLIRQAFLAGDRFGWMQADLALKQGSHAHPAYQAIPNAMSQAVLRRLGQDWKGYFAALSEWKKNPTRFKAKPRMPGYARQAKTASMPFQHLSCRDGQIHFPSKTGLAPVKVRCCVDQTLKAKGADQIIQEIRFVPHGSCYWLEVVYENTAIQQGKGSILLDLNKHLSIDLGIDNLATLISDQPGFRPVLVNGKAIKSVNHLYNKDAAVLRSKGHGQILKHKAVSRFCWMNDHLHRVSHFVIDQCLQHDIGRIVVGLNPDWKQGVGIGKVNNQKFVSIPHARLVEQIRYKAKAYGIEVAVREESYTSKASALDLDRIPTYGLAGTRSFTGRRLKRGLYQSSTGLLLNADVNGALNILRKEIGDSFMKSVADEGLVFRPRRVTLG